APERAGVIQLRFERVHRAKHMVGGGRRDVFECRRRSQADLLVFGEYHVSSTSMEYRQRGDAVRQALVRCEGAVGGLQALVQWLSLNIGHDKPASKHEN